MTIPKTQARNQALFKYAALVIVVGALALAYKTYANWNSVETDDAYTAAEIAQISAQTGGTVLEIVATDTQEVKAGDVLVKLDPADATLKLQEIETQIQASSVELQRASIDLDRRQSLKDTGSVTAEEITRAQYAFDMAKANLDTAKAKKDQAKLDLERTTIKAPVSGVVAKRQVQLGQRVGAGALLMTVVPVHELHVDANFKEIQLDGVQVGQQAKVKSDLYGDKVIFHGVVQGFSGGTGSAFAAIPSQNATGNWIKVVQRVPVRIKLDEQELAQHPLKVGLSMSVEIEKKDVQAKP
jgi:membrane fusion protein (multidrug efflux system)